MTGKRNSLILFLGGLFSLLFQVGCNSAVLAKSAIADSSRDAASSAGQSQQELCNEGQKLRIAVFALSHKDAEASKNLDFFGLEELLTRALKANNRFNIVERQSLQETFNTLEPIISEIKLSMTGLVDKDAIIEVGYEKLMTALKRLGDQQAKFTYQDGSIRAILKEIALSQTGLGPSDAARMAGYILSADCMLFYAIRDGKENDKPVLEINLIDVETQDHLIDLRTPVSSFDRASRKSLSRYLGQEIEKQLPNARGTLIKASGDQIKVSFESAIPLKTSMKLNILQLTAPVRNRAGRILCHGTDLLGQARIISVAGNTAIATLRDGLRITELEPNIIAIIR